MALLVFVQEAIWLYEVINVRVESVSLGLGCERFAGNCFQRLPYNGDLFSVSQRCWTRQSPGQRAVKAESGFFG